MYARQLIKQEPMHGLPVAVKTEPKPEPVDTYSTPSLADLDGITDLLPMQTGKSPFKPLSSYFGALLEPLSSPFVFCFLYFV